MIPYVLEPCPFCGEEGDLEVEPMGNSSFAFVWCHGCGAKGPGMPHDKAAHAWNSRAAPQGETT